MNGSFLIRMRAAHLPHCGERTLRSEESAAAAALPCPRRAQKQPNDRRRQREQTGF